MRLRALLLFLLMMLLQGSGLLAQNQPLVSLFPDAGGQNVDPESPIRIRAPGPIAPHTVSIHYPNADTRGLTFDQPTVQLYESSTVGQLASQRNATFVYGSIEITDPTTITFTHGKLRDGTSYHCVVHGVAINGGMVLPDLEFDFNTRSDAPQVRSCTLDSMRLLGCTQRVYVRFTENLSALGIDPNRIVKCELLDTAGTTTWVPLPIQTSLDPNGNTLSIDVVGGWQSGASLRLTIALSTITGDHTADREYTTVIRNAGKLSIDVRAADNRNVPEVIAEQFKHLEQVAVANTELYLASPRNLGDRWRFIRWTCPLLSLPAGQNVHVTIPCDLLRANIPITAIVERIDSQILEIEVDSGGVVQVFDAAMNLYATLDHSGAITLSDQLTKVVVIAKPKNGFKFKKWISPWKPADCKTSSALVLGPPFQNDVELNYANNYSHRISAVFEPWSPAGQVYRLRADIVDVDADPLFNPLESVLFTTMHEFEENVETSRQVCAEATQCWQIIGYSITSTNTIEFFDPVERLCVTGKLTNPENRIIFFVKRETMFLRVEKVLISSDNISDVIRGKRTHPETYIVVEKRGINNAGAADWVTQQAAACDDNGIPFSTYELKCGDAVRFRVKGSEIRAEVWTAFADVNGYAVPTQVAGTGKDKLYELVVDQQLAFFNATDCNHQDLHAPEIRVRGCFRQKFGIESIAMKVRVQSGDNRSNNTFIERWFDPLMYRERADDEPPGSHQLEYFPYHGTRIRIKFTLPIDVQTVFAGGMKAHSYSNTLVTDLSATGLDFEVFASNNEHIQFEMRDGDDINTVVFDICDPTTTPRLQALHGGLIDLTCFTSLKSLSGSPLRANTMFTFDRMQLPGYAMTLNSALFKFDGDNDIWPFENSGDMYFAFYGGDMAVNEALHIETGFQRLPKCDEQQGTVPDDCTIAHSDKDGAMEFSNHLLWMQPNWMDTRDYAWFRGASYDEECKDENDCWVNRISEMIYSVRDRADGYKTNSTELNWETIVPNLIAIGTEFLGTLLVPDDQDQFLGEVNFLEPGGSMWGMKSPTAPVIQLVHPNVTFTLTGRFYVDKAIVR